MNLLSRKKIDNSQNIIVICCVTLMLSSSSLSALENVTSQSLQQNNSPQDNNYQGGNRLDVHRKDEGYKGEGHQDYESLNDNQQSFSNQNSNQIDGGFHSVGGKNYSPQNVINQSKIPQSDDFDEPAEFEADELEYSFEESVITAKGNVDVFQGGRALHASAVEYNQNTNILKATGNIHLENNDGSHYYADEISLNDKLTVGEISNLNGRLSDGALIAANHGQKKSKQVTILNGAAYSACKVCAKKYNGKALWRVSARRVKIDDNSQRVSYKDAVLDVYGVPILYTPYISHPTPGAERKSGLLVPTYKNTGTLGFSVDVPYYFNLADNMDITLRPIITSKEGVVLAGEYRRLVRNGQYEVSGSITNPQRRDDVTGLHQAGHEIRSHVEGKGAFNLENDWSAGFDFKHSSDDTYLRRYEFGNEDVLISQASLEKIQGKNYFGARAVHFKGLNDDDNPDTTPLIFPLIDGYYETDEFKNGGYATFNGNILALSREIGVDSKRVSTMSSWHLPYVTNNGHLFEFISSIRGDGYIVDNVENAGRLKDGITGRIIPQMQVKWSYPLTRRTGQSSIFIEPVVDVIASPNGGNPDKIPNEDSLVIELSDVNLFSNNHFAGFDRVENGVRSNYGVRGYVVHQWANFDFLLGQSYRVVTNNSFTNESGLHDNFSDFVGRFALHTKIDTKKMLSASYRFRADKDDYTLRRNEVSANFDFSSLSGSLTYVMVDEEDNQFNQQEIVAHSKFDISDSWAIDASGHRNLSDTIKNGVKEEGWRSASFGVTYSNECLKVNTGVKREFFRDRDIEPSTTIMLRIGLKNLGL